MSVLTDNPVSRWAFLNEPLYRWFLMVGGFILILAVWRAILGYMK